MQNIDIRGFIKQNRVKWWQVAEYLGIHESALSRKLRHELPEDQKAIIREAIQAVANGGVGNA